jgi:hypothetical protein
MVVSSREDRRAARHAFAWRITDAVNNVTRKVFGPAQLSSYEPVQRSNALPSTPCAACGKPLDTHALVRSEHERMRLYCPDPKA